MLGYSAFINIAVYSFHNINPVVPWDGAALALGFSAGNGTLLED